MYRSHFLNLYHFLYLNYLLMFFHHLIFINFDHFSILIMILFCEYFFSLSTYLWFQINFSFTEINFTFVIPNPKLPIKDTLLSKLHL